MRIGIDARELCGRATGVGRYLAGLLSEWARTDAASRHEFVLYAPEPPPTALDARRFPTHVVSGSGGTWWEQRRMPTIAARDHLDVFFSPGYTAPIFRSTPTVVAIHDVSFAAHPEWFTVREGARRRWLTRQSAAQARAVITISHFSQRELIERLGVPESKIRVIPPGITPPRAAASSQNAAILFVGSIFNRRHVPELLRGFATLARTHPNATLDLVGDNRTLPRLDIRRIIENQRLDGRARWRAWISDDDLGALYGSARAFAFLSEYEGLGLTPLEALAVGVPPVLLDTPVARESCGAAALYVGGLDQPTVAGALERALFDESARFAVLAAAPAVLARYSWARAATDTLQVLEDASRPVYP
jgi:glycosyltransferase involved in cell wall biosynthesis